MSPTTTPRASRGRPSYLEKVSFNPFGPVDNGRQRLYGLDYRMASWRNDEEDPFHTEVGYWLWDADAGQVMRAFMVPRATVVLAGGSRRAADDTEFTMIGELGEQTYGVLENQYLNENASTVRYEVKITDGRRRVVLRGGHRAAHEGVRRALPPHRRQHPPPRRLTPSTASPDRREPG